MKKSKDHPQKPTKPPEGGNNEDNDTIEEED